MDQQPVYTDPTSLLTLTEDTYKISQRLQGVDTKPWVGKTLLLRVRSVNRNQILLEVHPPNVEEEDNNSIKIKEVKHVKMALIQEGAFNPPSISNEALSDLPDIPAKEPALNCQDVTYGVEPKETKVTPKFYQPMPLKTELYDFSLKVPTIIDYIRKKQNVIFEASRFSGKRKCIGNSIVSRINPYSDTFATRILVITFERESAEYFHEDVQSKTTHMKNVRLSLCVGSTKVRDNVRELQQGCQVVFGTPARLEDLLKRGVLKLQDVNFVAMYCNQHLPAEFQEHLSYICRHLTSDFQYLITYPLGANFDFKLLQTYTFNRFADHLTFIDNTPHFHRLNVVSDVLYKRDVICMVHAQQRIGLICDRQDLRMIDMWLGDMLCPVKCLVPTYQKLPSKGRERRHFIKQSKTLFKERVNQFEWGVLIIVQESVKFAPTSLDGSLDAVIILGNTPKLHDPEYRDHLLVKPGGHVFVNVPDLQFDNVTLNGQTIGEEKHKHGETE